MLVSCVRTAQQALSDLTAASAATIWQQLLAPLLPNSASNSTDASSAEVLQAGGDGGSDSSSSSIAQPAGPAAVPACPTAAAAGAAGVAGNDNVCLLVYVVAVQQQQLQQLMHVWDLPALRQNSWEHHTLLLPQHQQQQQQQRIMQMMHTPACRGCHLPARSSVGSAVMAAAPLLLALKERARCCQALCPACSRRSCCTSWPQRSLDDLCRGSEPETDPQTAAQQPMQLVDLLLLLLLLPPAFAAPG